MEITKDSLFKYINSCNKPGLLNKLQSKVKNRLEELSKVRSIAEIESEIKTKGFSIKPDKFTVPRVHRSGQKYYVEVMSHDKDEHDDMIVSHSHDDQNDWVELLGFNYSAGKKDNDRFEDFVGEWDYSDWDDPCFCKAYIYMYIYYPEAPLFIPENHSTFRCFNMEDGTIITCKIDDNVVDFGIEKILWEDINWDEFFILV